ncbi:hypothetical protein [Flavobacterium ajazii]|uniref:hypothetical protein n=1 Tax=Flavobacterium ajazii TaxID=2692318 RepID=UPI0013D60956|nr:hypothetical protein [Flavobacterium ajazii]
MTINKSIGFILLILISFQGISQKKEDTPIKFDEKSKEYKVIINKEVLKKYSFNSDYPAVTLSLRQNTFIYSLNNSPYEKAENFNQESKNADLWIEPRDPEINSFPEETSQLKLVNQKWEFNYLKNIKDFTLSEYAIERKNIKTGTIFLIKMTEGKIFKVRIDSFNIEKEEISLTYKLLE